MIRNHPRNCAYSWSSGWMSIADALVLTSVLENNKHAARVIDVLFGVATEYLQKQRKRQSTPKHRSNMSVSAKSNHAPHALASGAKWPSSTKSKKGKRRSRSGRRRRQSSRAGHGRRANRQSSTDSIHKQTRATGAGYGTARATSTSWT